MIGRPRFTTHLSPLGLPGTSRRGIYEFPGAVVPTWAKIGAYIDAGGLGHVDIHKEPVAPREKGGRAVKRARKDEGSASVLWLSLPG